MSNAPLIPSSTNSGAVSIGITDTPLITNNDITIQNGSISGLTDPIALTDISNKNYVDNTIVFSQTNNITTVDTADNVTYTTEQIIGGIISRDPNGNSRFDSFPTSAAIIAGLGSYGISGIFFTLEIANISSSDNNPQESIIINYSDVDIIGISTNLVIYPESTAFFYFTLSGNSLIAYYSSNPYFNFSNTWKQTLFGPEFTVPLRTLQFVPDYINVYNYQLFSNDIPPIPNCIFNILGDYVVESTGSASVNSSLPTAEEVSAALGYSNGSASFGTTFIFTIKLTAFTAGSYSVTVVTPSDSSIAIDSNSTVVLNYTDTAWKYASYYIISTGASSAPFYTAYCVSYYDTFVQ